MKVDLRKWMKWIIEGKLANLEEKTEDQGQENWSEKVER